MTLTQSHQDVDKRILYVDDEPQALKYFQKMFGDRFAIVTAISADEAFKFIEENPGGISVLLTDQRMPGRTGVELMEQVKNECPGIVRVLVTAHTHLESAIRAVNDGGAFRYLTKPWNENELIGTLLRAQEFHAALSERDRLLKEKLSVLHRLVIMDRVRGLTTMATALAGPLRNTWPALVEYMDQSPVSRRIQIQMDEISQLNMVALARREAEGMVRTVQQIQRDTTGQATGDTQIDLPRVTKDYALANQDRLADDDIELLCDEASSPKTVTGDAGMLRHLVAMMVQRLSDVQEKPTRIHLSVEQTDDKIRLTVRGEFPDLDSQQLASFFAAAIPLKKWPIGLDMDLLACFFICHHMGGSIEIIEKNPEGPAIAATIPTRPPESAASSFDPGWFDSVYQSLEAWQSEFDDADLY